MKNNIGVHIPSILMPADGIDLSKWAVIACDQYTSQPAYWENVKKYIGKSPSTFNIIFPEAFLEDDDAQDRIKRINNTMKEYIEGNILIPQEPGFIYTERELSDNRTRKGLVMAIDLEEYDYTKGSQSLVRATEDTIIERLPARVKIRENAYVESPHIIALIDDPDKTVIEPVSQEVDKLKKIYDFDLMMGGGNIKGYKIDDREMLNNIINALSELANPETFKKKYNIFSDKGILLFAVGDGNHSLATAKVHWENIKKTLSKEEIEDHPARYALVEVINLHDDDLKMEPIHRVVFNVDSKKMLKDLLGYLNAKGCEAEFRCFGTKEEMDGEYGRLGSEKGFQTFAFVTPISHGVIYIKHPRYSLEVAALDAFLNEYIKDNANIKIDYIHGGDVLDSLGSKEGNIGFFLPPIDKYDLFKIIIEEGVLPRKTFSIGEANEKRYYLECRCIRK